MTQSPARVESKQLRELRIKLDDRDGKIGEEFFKSGDI